MNGSIASTPSPAVSSKPKSTAGRAEPAGEPAGEFVQSLAANLAYWQARARSLTEQDFRRLNVERKNLFLAIRYGLVLPKTWPIAVDLIVAFFEWMEVYGYWRDWGFLIEQALAQAPDDLTRQCQLLYRLGFLDRLREKNPQAMERYLQAAALAEQISDPAETAYVNFFLADGHCALQQFAEAGRYAAMALEMFRELGESGPKLAGLYNTLGMIYHVQGRYPEAQTAFHQALPLWKTAGRMTKQAITLDNLAMAYQDARQYEEARQCLEAVQELLAAADNPLARVRTQLSLGLLHFEMGTYLQAEAAFRQIDTVYLLRAGHLSLLAHTLNNLGNALMEQHRFQEAAPYLERSLSLWRQLHDSLMLANTASDLAKTLVYLGEWGRPRPLYEEALSIFARFSQNAWASRMYQKLLAQRTFFMQDGEPPA
jgi:tetratricopeptide (TPR) repeat protein